MFDMERLQKFKDQAKQPNADKEQCDPYLETRRKVERAMGKNRADAIFSLLSRFESQRKARVRSQGAMNEKYFQSEMERLRRGEPAILQYLQPNNQETIHAEIPDVEMFKTSNQNLQEMIEKNKQDIIPEFMDDLFGGQSSNEHVSNQSCTRSCKQLETKSFSNIYNTLPNNKDSPILIESNKYSNLNLSHRQQKTSNFSNFFNYRVMVENQNRQRSKYFDVYYPKQQKESVSLVSSLSSSTDGCKSDLTSRSMNDNSSLLNSTSTKLTEAITKYDLNTSPVQFNMDKVSYVNTLNKAKQIVNTILERSKVISMNCDSDCCLQNGIDLLEIAITYDDSLDHPDIYVFDIHLEPKIIDLFKPVFANPKIVKVMFDARFDLRILSRKYGVNEFTALFDLQLAYRVLLAKLTSRPFEEVKREKLFYISWQCNGPLVNLKKMQLPHAYYFKNRKFWKTRPINFEVMNDAAHDVFVMVPQLFTNLMVIMERSLDEEHHQLFIKCSNDLITRNLVPRKFAFFHSKHQYLGEIHRQIDLLIQSDIIHRNKQTAKWQRQLLDEDYVEEYQESHNSFEGDLLKNQINDIDTDSYKSFSNSSENLTNSLNSNSMTSSDLYQNHHLNSLNRSTSNESGTHTNESGRSPIQNDYCDNCRQPIKHDKLGELLNNLETDSLKELLFSKPNYCQCIQSRYESTDEEMKCMNLLVDQIIDLAECKEDYMELEE